MKEKKSCKAAGEIPARAVLSVDVPPICLPDRQGATMKHFLISKPHLKEGGQFI
jgi:hypothetical protein